MFSNIARLAAAAVLAAALAGCQTTCDCKPTNGNLRITNAGSDAVGVVTTPAPVVAAAPAVAAPSGEKRVAMAPKLAEVSFPALDCATNRSAQTENGPLTVDACPAGIFTVKAQTLKTMPYGVALGTSSEMGDRGGQCLVAKVIQNQTVKSGLGDLRANGSFAYGLNSRGLPVGPIVVIVTTEGQKTGMCNDLAASDRFVLVTEEQFIAALMANPAKVGMFGATGPAFVR